MVDVVVFSSVVVASVEGRELSVKRLEVTVVVVVIASGGVLEFSSVLSSSNSFSPSPTSSISHSSAPSSSSLVSMVPVQNWKMSEATPKQLRVRWFEFLASNSFILSGTSSKTNCLASLKVFKLGPSCFSLVESMNPFNWIPSLESMSNETSLFWRTVLSLTAVVYWSLPFSKTPTILPSS